MAISYPTVLALITNISKWVEEGIVFQFIGDNVAKQKGVRDVRSDHHGHLVHMYSLLAVKARIPPPLPCSSFSPPDLTKLDPSHFLPSPADVSAISC